jgi:hypothetical protein
MEEGPSSLRSNLVFGRDRHASQHVGQCIALRGLLIAQASFVGVLAEFAPGAPLAQQVPTLGQRHLNRHFSDEQGLFGMVCQFGLTDKAV